MSVTVLTNQIPDPSFRESIADAVEKGIGSRPAEETWEIRIFAPQESSELVIKINGPGNFRWKRNFFGPVELTPEFIQKEVDQAEGETPNK